MKPIPRIPTRRWSSRIFDYCETSWVPALMFYAVLLVAVLALNWSNL